ncbi:MAG: hypothetical protein ACI4RD_02245 [Kiritimatiellia bacterium]
MKNWQNLAILALLAAVAVLGCLVTFGPDAPAEAKEEAIVAFRKPDPQPGRKVKAAVRIGAGEGVRAPSSADFALGGKDEKDMTLSFGDDFGFEEEIKEKLTSVIQEIYDQYLAASDREDRKAMLASIQRILSKMAAGEKVPVWLRQQLVEGVKWVGGLAFPELMAMAADADVGVSSSALDALQELLWDFDTTPQQIADALNQVVKLSTDATVIEPFVNEMDTMPMSLRVSTALAIFDSGNEVAIKCLQDNTSFVFDDFDGNLKTREDLVQYAQDQGVELPAGTVSGQQ